MKCLIAYIAAFICSANAFSVQQQGRKDVSLCATSDGKATPIGWMTAASTAAAVTAFAGWTLATVPLASAVVPPVDMVLPGRYSSRRDLFFAHGKAWNIFFAYIIRFAYFYGSDLAKRFQYLAGG